MSIQHVDDALCHFFEYQPLLGVTSSNDIDECVLLASNEGRLRFTEAVLDVIVSGHVNLPETIVQGGLRAVVDPAATILPYSLFAEDVPANVRASVLGKMRAVFTEVFSRRCESTLAHRATTSLPQWNLLCFMWWELLPRHGVPPVAFLAETDLAILELMGSVLELDHVACKEAALHGLGLWGAGRPDDVRRLIERHVDAIPPALRDYALAAKFGNLQ